VELCSEHLKYAASLESFITAQEIRFIIVIIIIIIIIIIIVIIDYDDGD